MRKTNDITIDEEEIKGSLSVKMANNQTLDDVCMQYIPDYNRDRFEAFAIRVFLGDETVVTIYAIDKLRIEDASQKKDKVPVKKFKLTDISLQDLFSYCSAFNCTLNTGNYDLDDMEVVNK
ncbi:hypothetical protein [Ferruginibacter albus]|uniref:hypothetical protein n=1 Tax=Ferruginibacter albus TaxID=2875540 RepID=UPI001CC6D21F|nr:hypothetical protein [Ferruginibacter albus]UAY52969.1 hypothetical protein K9M53_04650 [Ferruginibacter albus]